MAFTDDNIVTLQENGWTLLEGYLSSEELAIAQEALHNCYPTLDEYESDKSKYQWLQGDPFAGEISFPFSQPHLRKLPFQSAILNLTETFLQTETIFLYRANLQAKFAGASNFDQPLHFDFPNHSLVVPGKTGDHRQLGFFIYFSDITEDLGPTHFVSKKHSQNLPAGYTHFFKDRKAAEGRSFFKYAPELYEIEVAAVGPAGSLLVYELDTLHRGSQLTARSGVRLTLSFAYGGAHSWQGFQCWPRLAEEQDLRAFITTATPRERELLGFPSIGDPYWTSDTCDRVEARYPGIDLGEYRAAINAS